jgi:hypothetical protein
MGMDAEGKEVLKEIEIDPAVLIEFPSVDLRENETFEGWFKDAEFTKPVAEDKAMSPKKGERHFYGRYLLKDTLSEEEVSSIEGALSEDTSPENTDSGGKDG